MKTTVFNCDKCGQAFEAGYDDKSQVIKIKNKEIYLTQIEIRITEVEPYNCSEMKKATKQICTECLKNIGLEFDIVRGTQDRLPIQVTVEDKFIDILSELGVKFEE